jgi:hypothetical protein
MTMQSVEQGNASTQIVDGIRAVLRDVVVDVLSDIETAKYAAYRLDIKPDFARGETCTKTIRLSTAMVEAAERKARTQDKAVTHGSFSGLVEYLLWRYLDSSPDYLKREDS